MVKGAEDPAYSVMRTENLDFIDALKLLADNAGIIIPEDDEDDE